MKNIFLLLTAVCSLFLAASCKKESFITSSFARLVISADSIKFDTVFTTTGSVTRSFKITNDNDQRLLLSKVKLMGGTSSPFKININGSATPELNNLEIAANDSIYVFVTVTVNPTASNLPFIISDSILINYNGNNRFVQLQAYGQNANFLHNTIIASNTTWNNARPFVIMGSLRIDTTATLTIEQGTKIYSHADAPIIVDGTLIINGTNTNRVLFAGDRLDEYKDLPAGWPGIYFRGSSKNSVFTYAVIKNAYQAIVVQQPTVNANPKLVIHQSIIDNAYDAGLICINSTIAADNTLISNCGSGIVIRLGGQYTFTHCTIASYSNYYLLHKIPVVSVANFADVNGTTATADLSAMFRNCIFWGDNGSVENEVEVNKQGNTFFSVILDHCLYKAAANPANTTLIAEIRNLDPLFDSIDTYNRIFDFRISRPQAPGINKGITTSFPRDLDDNNRNNALPDLGSYEKQ
ncbi:MAG TPA: hypothetical protein VK498_10285 [Ferruginibacter sp.]|nr:hypothetical protein [Ferruginibacter sp.]